MKITLFFMLIILAGCMSTQEYESALNPKSTGPQVDIVWYRIKPDTVISGRTYYVEDFETPSSLDPQTMEKVRGAIRRKMNEYGFQEVKAMRKAYFGVYLVADWERLADDNATSVRTSTTRFENGKIVSQFSTTAKRLARFTMAIFANSYGKRPVEISRLFIKAPAEEGPVMSLTFCSI